MFSVASTAAPQQAVTLALDLNGEETPAELLSQICAKAGIAQEDIVLAWASPPCETFSRANASNVTRGHHYRDAQDGYAPVQGAKGVVAKQHDRLVGRVKEILHLIGTYVMENPQGGLERMWYMADWEDKKKIVELCAFVWPFKKTTNLWASGFKWDPKGVTGDGRCHEQCGQGSVDPLTHRFRHYMALAVDPQRGPRGPQATRMTCGIPDMLITEILKAMAETQQLRGKVVLDLCAGFQSIRRAVEKAGATYVGVDLKGNRNGPPAEPRRGAVLLCYGANILAVKQRLSDGSLHWKLPGGQQQQHDQSLHHAALRELALLTGLGHNTFRDRVKAGPQLLALKHTTYFTYALNSPIPQAELARSLAGLRSKDVLDVKWLSQGEAQQARWRPEDEAVLERLWQHPVYSTWKGDAGDVEL